MLRILNWQKRSGKTRRLDVRSRREDARLFEGSNVEFLEPRLLLAGNVSVEVRGGDLIVEGDNNGNQLAIRSTLVDGVFVVQGLDGESINGSELDSLVFFNVDDDIRIDLRGGDNQLILTGGQGSKNGFIPFEVNDDLSIQAGSGDNAIVLDRINVRDDVKVKTGGGNDTFYAFLANVDDDVRVSLGDGDNAVYLTNLEIAGKASFKMRNGDDSFASVSTDLGALSVKTSGGSDLVGVRKTNSGRIKLNAGGGESDRLLDDNEGFTAINGRNFEDEFVGSFFGEFVPEVSLRSPTFSIAQFLSAVEGTNNC